MEWNFKFLKLKYSHTPLLLLYSIICVYLWVKGIQQARFSADDYCFNSLVSDAGFSKSLQYLLNNSGPYLVAYGIQLGVLTLKISPGIYLSFLFIIFLIILETQIRTVIQKGLKLDLKIRVLSIFATLLFSSTLLYLPSHNQGAFVLTTIGWSAGTSRLIALIFLLYILRELLKDKPKPTRLLILNLLITGCDFSTALSSSLLIIFVSGFKMKVKREVNLHLIANTTLSSFVIGLNVLLTKTEGSKNRLKALDEGMRHGEKFSINHDALLSAKYNAYRIVNESFSFKVFIFILILALYTSIAQTNSPEPKYFKVMNKAFAHYFILLILVIAFTWIGSVIAYLQNWHFLPIILLWYMSIFYLSSIFFSRLRQKQILIKHKKYISVAGTILISFIAINSFSQLDSFDKTLQLRETLFDIRSNSGSFNNIPILDLNGFALTEDLNSEWVKNCYKRSLDN